MINFENYLGLKHYYFFKPVLTFPGESVEKDPVKNVGKLSLQNRNVASANIGAKTLVLSFYPNKQTKYITLTD